MITVKLFAFERAISKAGNAYMRQAAQIVQFPIAPDLNTYHIVNSEAEALPPGEYRCNVVLRNDKGGALRVKLTDFQPVEKN